MKFSEQLIALVQTSKNIHDIGIFCRQNKELINLLQIELEPETEQEEIKI